jgi:hypothetical protein
MPTQNATSPGVLFGQVMAGCAQLALATVVPPNASPALSRAAEPGL